MIHNPQLRRVLMYVTGPGADESRRRTREIRE